MLKKELYALILSSPIVDNMYLFYSEGPIEANKQAKALVEEHGGDIRSLKSWPTGFKLGSSEVAGTITVPDDH